MNNLDRFQSRLGYEFNNADLLNQALSHRSVGRPNNERLEFLGDSIIGFYIAEMLFRRFPSQSEGALTKMRASLVREKTLAIIARKLEMQPLLIMGGGEMKSGGFNRDSVLSDAFESIVGAVYLDGGISSVETLLHNIYCDMLEAIQPAGLKDSKTALQEFLQKRDYSLPIYEVVDESGDAHDLVFTVICRISGFDYEFQGVGKSRKLAEQTAAALALAKLSSKAK